MLGVVVGGGGDQRCHRRHLGEIMLRRVMGMVVMSVCTVAIVVVVVDIVVVVVVVSPLIVPCHQRSNRSGRGGNRRYQSLSASTAPCP